MHIFLKFLLTFWLVCDIIILSEGIINILYEVFEMNMDSIKTATGAKSTADILKRQVIGDFIELTFKKCRVLLRLKDWNKDYFEAKTFILTERH